MAVDSTEAPRLNCGKIALGPISLWIWWAWKWTRISWSLAVMLNPVSVHGVWFLEGADSGTKPDANFRGLIVTLYLPFCDTQAFSRHSSSEASSNIQCLAWALFSKSSSPMAVELCLALEGASCWFAGCWLNRLIMRLLEWELCCKKWKCGPATHTARNEEKLWPNKRRW